jgi:cytosine/adenosine deaminase-related metal-dependent hydrolase
VQVDESDCALLSRRGVSVAICPRSNRSLRVGTAPVRRLLAAGVRLCLGTDSLASAGTLDLMADMALLQSQFPELAPEVVVRMATLGGAQALGLPELGAIEAGRSGDLAFVPATASPAEPLRFLTSGVAQAGPLPA